MEPTNAATLLQNISIEEYNYPLPADRIAYYPAQERDKSLLLVSTTEGERRDHFSNLVSNLPKNSILVFNETKVVQARMEFHKSSGARIEIFCLEPISPVTEVQLAFSQHSPVSWKCLVGNSRRWKAGKLTYSTEFEGVTTHIAAERTQQYDTDSEILFTWDNPNLCFSDIMENLGEIPLPPYIQRETEESDSTRYQTIYAKNKGSVAAPTAGLHFTDGVMNDLKNAGIETDKITLHVGAGTFKPVSSDTIGEHQMHTEQIIISKKTILNLLNRGEKNIIPVGTTTARTLESLYWFGAKLFSTKDHFNGLDVKQWDPYNPQFQDISTYDSLKSVLKFLEDRQSDFLSGNTSLLIGPGYKWHLADALITNFHQPKSTLLLLVSSFVGSRWERAYKYALDNDFRFLSYGDSCLFFPNI